MQLIAALSLAETGVVQSNNTDPDESSRDSFTILEGTEHETTVYETVAPRDGPTVFVIGGIHGNEEAGWVAANEIAEWPIESGTLITIPEANPTAIEANSRRGADGTDLNRQFPTGEPPQTALAEAIWSVVEAYNPDVLIDLHESIGIYAGDPIDGVDQAIFHSGHDEATLAADRAIEYVNDNYVDEPERYFMTGGFTGPDTDPEGLLVHKVYREHGTIAFLQETLRIGVELQTRVNWQLVLVAQLTDAWL